MTVRQLPINTVAVVEGGTIKLFVTPAANCQSATAGLFLLILYCIDSMFTLQYIMLSVGADAEYD